MGAGWGEAAVDDAPVGVGQYSVIAKLGQGGMAGVFLAVARGPVSDFHKLVVLKRLHESLRMDEDFVRMFVREAQIAARLNHPNVVHTYSVDLESGQPVLVMEYLDGVSLSTLRRRIADRPLHERLPLLGAVAEALAGLHYVHDLSDYDGSPMGLVHRDIKPANVFITFDGQVKVLDFGIAKATAPGQDATNSHVLKGTARYMAPEAVGGGGTIDRRADVFSAGVMLWELISGKRLWEDAEDLQIIRRLMDNDVPSLDSVSPDTPPELTQLCTKALQLDPDHRHSSAAELRSDLLAFVHGQGLTDIGAALVALMDVEFGHRRELRAATIRARLAESKDVIATGGADMRTLPSTGSSVSNALPAAGPVTSQTEVAAKRSSMMAFVAAGAILLALGGAGVWGWLSRADDEPKADASSPAPEPAGAEAAEAEPQPTPPAAQAEPIAEADPIVEVEEPAPQVVADGSPDEADPDADPDAEAEDAPARRPKRRASKRGRGAKSDPTPNTEVSQPTPQPAADAALQPGEMPTKKTKKKTGLSIDKDSPWGGRP